MKTKMLALAVLPLLALAACSENTASNEPNSRIHGEAGVSVKSGDTSHISLERGTER